MQTEIEGWIIGTSIDKEGPVIWIKEKSGTVLKGIYGFDTRFYVDPGVNYDYIKNIPEQHPLTKRTVREVRYSVKKPDRPLGILRIETAPHNFYKLVQEISATGLFGIYGADLPPAEQIYYFTDLFPFCKCIFLTENRKVQRKFNGRRYIEYTEVIVRNIRNVDDNSKIFYARPPLRALKLELMGTENDIDGRSIKYNIYMKNNPTKGFRLVPVYGYKEDEKEYTYIGEDSEEDVLVHLEEEILRRDPDIILTENGDTRIFPYLNARISALGMETFTLSRDGKPLTSGFLRYGGKNFFMSYGRTYYRGNTAQYLSGRDHIDINAYGSLHFSDGNIPALIEIARICRMNLQRLVRVTIGGALQSLQYYTALKKGYIIPSYNNTPENFISTRILMDADRGGHTLTPVPGVYFGAVEMDFYSMYPSIMRKYNISGETVNCECCRNDENRIKVPGLPFHICIKKKGIVPESLALPLEKRRIYRELLRKYFKGRPSTVGVPPEFADEWDEKSVRGIDAALKWILVVSFGYLGFKNGRFGRVDAHQTVCAYAREILLDARRIAEDYGFKILHGIVDSLWISERESYSIQPHYGFGKNYIIRGSHGKFPPDDVLEEVAGSIGKHTGILIEPDRKYKFLIFLPPSEGGYTAVINRYWGVTTEGDIKVRGLEVRRRDTPPLIKKIQYDIMKKLSEADTPEEFTDKVHETEEILGNYLEEILSGNAEPEDLVIEKRLSRPISDYTHNTYHTIAARRFIRLYGISPRAGQKIGYIVKNTAASNPYNRVILPEEVESGKSAGIYDRFYYATLAVKSLISLIPFRIPFAERLNSVLVLRKDIKIGGRTEIHF